jgi:two-component system sensor kinase FixL
LRQKEKPVSKTSFVCAYEEGDIGEHLLDGAEGALSPDRIVEALRESEKRLRALQNEFAHLARVNELGEMAAAVAHEINQPLTAITNYLNAGRMSARESTSEALARARQAMALAAEQGIRAGAIIRGLRAFARKSDGVRRTESADALVEAAMALALLGTEAAGIGVERELAAGGAMVEVDPVQIQQVLVNLLRNAVDALVANPPGVERRLTIATGLAEEGLVFFRIADTGAGIAPALRDRLFQPFVTSKMKGMGMGLSVCARIVEAHGGSIRVESAPGAGAAFTVRLPRAREG